MEKNIPEDRLGSGDIRIDEIMPELFSKWLTLPFEECLQDDNGDFVKLKQKQTMRAGKYPVVDQGEEFINGFVDDEALIYSGSLPVIIFGDHTRRIKFIDFKFAVGADGTKILKPKSFLNIRFFYHYLNSLKITSAGYSRHYKFLKAIDVPIPPPAEQQRIVFKLDRILAKVNNCKTRLNKIPTLLKNIRQSVLAAAVSGELTEGWRKENEAPYSVEETLKQIRNRRLLDAKFSSKEAEIDGIYTYNEEGLDFDIPSEWKFVSLQKICSDFQYGSSKKSTEEGLVAVLRMGNLQSGKIDWNDLKFSSDKDEISKYLLNENDVLFNRTNSPELVGKTSIYKGEQKALFAGYLIRINYLPELLPDYLNYCLNTPYAKEWCRFVKTDGVSQSNINAQKLAKFEIPFCSMEEQKEIVRKVEEQFHIADSIEVRYKKATGWFDRLPQSILSKAFRGELVPQDVREESANELLQKIKETKTTTVSQWKTNVVDAHVRTYVQVKKATKTSQIDINMDVVEAIKNKFGEEKFSYKQLEKALNVSSKSEYIESKKQFFNLLRNTKFKKGENLLIAEYDKDTATILYNLNAK